MTLVVEGAPDDAPAEELDDSEIRARAAELIAAGQSTGDAARALAELTGRPRREIYNLISRRRIEPSRLRRRGRERVRTSTSLRPPGASPSLSSTRKRRPGMSIDSR